MRRSEWWAAQVNPCESPGTLGYQLWEASRALRVLLWTMVEEAHVPQFVSYLGGR